MDKEIKAVKELFTQANNSNLIKGFLLGGDTVRFQTNDGTMMLLKVVPLEQNMDSETISTIEEDKGHEKYIVLEDGNFDCLMITVVSYKDLWEDVLAKGLVTLDENDEVIDNKTQELKKYLEEKGVEFSKKVNPKSDDMSYDYFAEFEYSQTIAKEEC